jgi:hypothetical protein
LAGLDPATHVFSGETVVKVVPIGVIAVDETYLPRTWPVFNVHLALLGEQDFIMPFSIDETLQAVSLGEPLGDAFAVFPGSPSEIDRSADVQRAVRPVCHEVYPTAHGS